MNACIGDCLHLKSNLYSRLWLSSSSTSTTKRNGNEHKVQRKPTKISLTIYDTHFTFIFLCNLIATDRSCLLRAYVCMCASAFECIQIYLWVPSESLELSCLSLAKLILCWFTNKSHQSILFSYRTHFDSLIAFSNIIYRNEFQKKSSTVDIVIST